MKYKPHRDIPRAILELKTTSPTEIAKWVQEHRTKIVSGKRVQEKVTSQSVSNWKRRHQKEIEKLEEQIKLEELPKEVISETLYQNGLFEETKTIKTWMLELRGRDAKEGTIQKFVNDIKRVCKGEIRKKGVGGRPAKEDYEIIEEWGLKHPDRLNLEDALSYISELKKRGHKTRQYRLSLRNFLESKGIKIKKISGKIEAYGKYAHLYISKEKLYEIFEYLKTLSHEAYLCAKFAYKCGGVRIGATLTAESTKVKYDGVYHTITVLEKATRGKDKRPQEKLIPEDFWKELEPRVERGGKLFRIEAYELNALLRTAYEKIIPKLNKEIPMPFHFLRHQFAQHMLRATGWNYGLVARLGHWTVETLERYYGKMDRQTAFVEATKHLPNL